MTNNCADYVDACLLVDFMVWQRLDLVMKIQWTTKVRHITNADRE